MRLLTVSNLYPRPDDPTRGLFNLQLFSALARQAQVRNICLVPEWRAWRMRAIRRWTSPAPDGPPTAYAPVLYLPVAGRDINWLAYLASMRGVGRDVSECDAVLATWLYPDAVAAGVLAARRGRPFAVRVHGSDLLHLRRAPRRAAIRRTAGAARAVICNCEAAASTLTGWGFGRDRLRVLPNGVDTGLFRFRPRAEAAGRLAGAEGWRPEFASPRCRIVLFAGHLVAVKGADILLEAWSRLVRDPAGPDHCRLVLVGAGPERGSLVRQAERLGLGGTVHFAGARSHSEVALWMNLADCLCISSRGEGMPNVLLEAFCSGLPVVASDAGGCREHVVDEACARLAPLESPEALAASLREVLDAWPDREAMAARYCSRFSWDAAARGCLEVLASPADAVRDVPETARRTVS